MTLREIFGKMGGILDYDLTPIAQVAFSIIVGIVFPIGLLWAGQSMLVDGFAKEQPHDRDLFGRIFLILSGFFCIGIALFIWWNIIKHFF